MIAQLLHLDVYAKAQQAREGEKMGFEIHKWNVKTFFKAEESPKAKKRSSRFRHHECVYFLRMRMCERKTKLDLDTLTMPTNRNERKFLHSSRVSISNREHVMLNCKITYTPEL